MHLEENTEKKAFVVANTRSHPMWVGSGISTPNSAGIWRRTGQQYTQIRGQPSMHQYVSKHCAQRTLAAHGCNQILCAGAHRKQACQAHAVWHQRDCSRCTDESLPYPPLRTRRNTMLDATSLRASTCWTCACSSVLR